MRRHKMEPLFQKLDHDMLDLVMSYLSTSELLCTMSRVCKYMSEAAHRNVRHIRLKSCVPPGTFSKALSRCCRVHTLEVECHHPSNVNWFLHFRSLADVKAMTETPQS
jgi:hypothetical protein